MRSSHKYLHYVLVSKHVSLMSWHSYDNIITICPSLAPVDAQKPNLIGIKYFSRNTHIKMAMAHFNTFLVILKIVF